MRYLLVLILFISSFSCEPLYIINSEGALRPRKDNYFSYKKHPFNLADTSIIDTNCIYVRYVGLLFFEKVGGKIDSIPHCHVHYRFYSTGQMNTVLTDTFPKVNEVNNPNIGSVGYYKIKNDKVYLQWMNAQGGRTKEMGIIKNGELLLYDKTDTFYPKLKKPEHYKKIEVKGMKYVKPDW